MTVFSGVTICVINMKAKQNLLLLSYSYHCPHPKSNDPLVLTHPRGMNCFLILKASIWRVFEVHHFFIDTGEITKTLTKHITVKCADVYNY